MAHKLNSLLTCSAQLTGLFLQAGKLKKTGSMKKELGLIDYTGSIFSSNFLYVLPGEYQPAQEFIILISNLPIGHARIAAVTRMPFGKLSETIARVWMGKPVDQVKAIMQNAYYTKDVDTISVICFEWLKMDNDAMKACMEIRFDALKGLNKHERNLKLSLV
jgi:hypothetical protein